MKLSVGMEKKWAQKEDLKEERINTMSAQSAEAKTYEAKINAQLQEIQSQIEAFETSANRKLDKAENQAIAALKAKSQEIDKKRHQLTTCTDAKAAEIKSSIDAELTKLQTSLQQFATKIKSQPATK